MPLWFEILVIIAVACFFVWYISPDRDSSPSRLRKSVAITWIFFRRLVSFTGAALGLFIIYTMWTSSGESQIVKVFTSLMLFVISGCFVFIGVVGIAKFESTLNLYKRVKKKYKIRW